MKHGFFEAPSWCSLSQHDELSNPLRQRNRGFVELSLWFVIVFTPLVTLQLVFGSRCVFAKEDKLLFGQNLQ